MLTPGIERGVIFDFIDHPSLAGLASEEMTDFITMENIPIFEQDTPTWNKTFVSLVVFLSSECFGMRFRKTFAKFRSFLALS